jgi:hypothetical protein
MQESVHVQGTEGWVMSYFETRHGAHRKAYGYFIYEPGDARSKELEFRLAIADARLRSAASDGEWVVNHVDTSARLRRVVSEVGRYVSGHRAGSRKPEPEPELDAGR